MKNEDGLDQRGNSGEGEKWWESGHILEIEELTLFPNGLCEGNRVVKGLSTDGEFVFR